MKGQRSEASGEMDIDEPRENAIAELEALEPGEKFVLVTQREGALDGEFEMNIQSHVAEDRSNLSLVNMAGVLLLTMSDHFDGYTLDEAAEDVLTAARLQAQGEMFSRE